MLPTTEEPALMVRIAAWYTRAMIPQPSSSRSLCASPRCASALRQSHSEGDLRAPFRVRTSDPFARTCSRSPCSRSPSTGARTASSASVEAASEDSSKFSWPRPLSCFIEDEPTSPSQTGTGTASAWGEDEPEFPAKAVCESPVGLHKSIDESGNFCAAHRYAVYVSGARLAPSIDRSGNCLHAHLA